MLKSFPNYLKRVNRNYLNIADFIRAYQLDDAKPLVPQVETYLGRQLLEKEKEELRSAYQLVVVDQYRENDEEERSNFQKTSRKKKKKKRWWPI